MWDAVYYGEGVRARVGGGREGEERRSPAVIVVDRLLPLVVTDHQVLGDRVVVLHHLVGVGVLVGREHLAVPLKSKAVRAGRKKAWRMRHG